MGRHSHDIPYTWQLPWLAVEQPQSALSGPLLTLLAQMATLLSPCKGTISGPVGCFL